MYGEGDPLIDFGSIEYRQAVGKVQRMAAWINGGRQYLRLPA